MIYNPSYATRSNKHWVHYWCREGYLTLHELRKQEKHIYHYNLFLKHMNKDIDLPDFVMYLQEYIRDRDAVYKSLLRAGSDSLALRHCIEEQNERHEDDE
jgi:hypothetical protein